jgi:ribosomal protein S18 acetylase RimI-like enzyme
MQPDNLSHRAVLFGLYITPKHRNKGIAGMLIKHVIDYVSSTHEQLHLTVNTTNVSAINLYLKHGFKVYGTLPKALKIGDKYFDEYLMYKEL